MQGIIFVFHKPQYTLGRPPKSGIGFLTTDNSGRAHTNFRQYTFTAASTTPRRACLLVNSGGLLLKRPHPSLAANVGLNIPIAGRKNPALGKTFRRRFLVLPGVAKPSASSGYSGPTSAPSHIHEAPPHPVTEHLHDPTVRPVSEHSSATQAPSHPTRQHSVQLD